MFYTYGWNVFAVRKSTYGWNVLQKIVKNRLKWYQECCPWRKDMYTVNAGNAVQDSEYLINNQNIKSVMLGVHKMVKHTLKILHQMLQNF